MLEIPPGAIRNLILDSLKRGSGDDLAIGEALGLLDLNLPAMWTLYADKGALSFRLRYLYTLRDCADFLARRLFDITSSTEGGVQQSDSDVFRALCTLRDNTTADITVLETQIRAGQAPQGGLMTTTRPDPVYPGAYPDPTAPYFRGLPFDPRVFGGS